MAWNLKYDGAVPPLPAQIRPILAGDAETRKRTFEAVFRGRRLLRHGCWVVRLQPEYSDDVEKDIHYRLYYEGTFRLEAGPVERAGDFRLRGSGDLYRRESPAGHRPPLTSDWKIYPIRDYRYYFGLSSLRLVSRSEIQASLDVYRYVQSSANWVPDGQLEATLWPRGGKVHPWLAGEVTNELGTTIGSLELRHLSEFLRRAVVQIDRVKRVEPPSQKGIECLKSAFENVDWVLTVNDDSKSGPVEEPTGPVWSNTSLHKHMLERRQEHPQGHDEEWRYHVLLVRRIRYEKYNYFGTMYDAWPADSNQVPREGVAVAAKARFPLDRELYGSDAGQVLQRVPRIYVHTIVHELGHAMGLAHNFTGHGFMQGFDNLAEEAHRTGKRMSKLMVFKFDSADADRLRHLPDHWVRPGGVPFHSGFGFEPVPLDDLADESPELELQIEPLNRILPFGAPLRLAFRLKNEGKTTTRVPPAIGLKSGYLAGCVFQDSGKEQPFATVVRYIFSPKYKILKSGEKVEAFETLLRGNRGALLPSSGIYRIEAEVAWELDGGRFRASGSTSVFVSPPEHEPHAEEALAILSSRELFSLLVFRSDGAMDGPARTDDPFQVASTRRQCRELERARAARELALESSVLGPHYAAFEAKRLAAEKSTLSEAASKITTSTVMTVSEATAVLDLLEKGTSRDSRSNDVKKAIKICELKSSPEG